MEQAAVQNPQRLDRCAIIPCRLADEFSFWDKQLLLNRLVRCSSLACVAADNLLRDVAFESHIVRFRNICSTHFAPIGVASDLL